MNFYLVQRFHRLSDLNELENQDFGAVKFIGNFSLSTTYILGNRKAGIRICLQSVETQAAVEIL